MITLVDSNVILDITSEDPVWGAWSVDALKRHGDVSDLAVNPIIYAEISMGYDKIEEVDSLFDFLGFIKLPLPWEAAFLAAKCYQNYRRRGGNRTSPLPDFFIGAHAAVSGLPLLTRDKHRFHSYFPDVQLFVP